MDLIVVGIILIAAIFFTVMSFIKAYKGNGSRSCKGRCGCPFMNVCKSQIVKKK